MRSKLARLCFLTILGFALTLPGLSRAASTDEHPSGSHRFFFAVGGYLMSLDNSAGLDSANGPGTTIDLETLLGLDDGLNVLRVEGYWRFANRHRLDWTWYYQNRDGNRTVANGFDYDGVRYDANALIHSEFKTQYLKVMYRFAFLNDDRIEVGLSAGLATFGFDMLLEGNGEVLVNGVPSGTTTFERSTNSIVAPVPNVGLYGEFRILPRLVLRQSFDYFSLSADDWRGRYAELRLGIDWRFTDHWGFGLGYDRTVLAYESGGTRSLDASVDNSGLVWYGSYSF